MAKGKIYRHDIRCPECGSNWVCKNGDKKCLFEIGDRDEKTFLKSAG